MLIIYKYISEIIKRARKEKGLSQKALVNEIGEHKVSLRTLRRIESGCENVKDEFIQEILDYFCIELRYVIRDEYEDKIIRNIIYGYDDMSIKDCIHEANGRIEEYRTLFHGEPHSMARFHITSLAEFLIYYPLFDSEMFKDVIQRIGGTINGRFYYVLDLMENLYRGISDKEMRSIADNLVERIWDDEHAYGIKDYEKYLKVLENDL